MREKLKERIGSIADAIKAAIKAMGDLQTVGGDVIVQKYYTAVYSITGVATVPQLFIDDVTPAVSGVNIVIASNEIATFALVNMTVTEV